MSKTDPAPVETAGTESPASTRCATACCPATPCCRGRTRAEYHALVAALAAEHAPQGPTEEHLVEELAGILWRKRRLRLAEAAAHRRGLEGTFSSYRETVKVALVHLDVAGQSERAADAIRATDSDTERTCGSWRRTRR